MNPGANRKAASPKPFRATYFFLSTRNMPFKSKAQRRKFAELLVEGKIKPETYEEWNRDTGGKKLPEHVRSKKKKGASKRGKSSKKGRRK
jgi:hypothetical protein